MPWLDRVNAAADCLPLPLVDVPADDYEARRDRHNQRNGWLYDFRAPGGAAVVWLESAAHWRREGERVRARQAIACARRANIIRKYEESST